VEGFDNLFCMEIDPAVDVDEGPDLGAGGGAGGASGGGAGLGGAMQTFLKDFSNNIPGIDELMSFAELMRHVQRMDFDVTVFDTAPTGHTLRLLSLPGMMDKALSKLMGLRSTFGGLLASAQAMMGGDAASGLPSEETILGKLDELKGVIDAVQARIHSPDETTFVCVCIPEFLSLYETERLVQELAKFDIDTHNIVVNQVLFPAETGSGDCSRCAARMRMQAKYLDQIADLYDEDFNVVRTPLLNEEVRGPVKLRAFGTYLLEQYEPGKPLPAELRGGAGHT
jgi:arsenite/tail-anchored protein-transporting ATPase